MSLSVMTIAGTRPELIRLSLLIPRLDASADHVFVHTGQNDHPALRDVFFDQLGLRRPDIQLPRLDGPWARRVGTLLADIGDILTRHRPDRVVLLGDTDSALSAIVAARMGIPVVHLEAGNRCFDDRVPEEVNRRLIDHASTLLLPYTDRSREHLLREGMDADRVRVVGNPIAEVLAAHRPAIDACDIAARLGVEPGGYLLVTLHRAENVDDASVLRRLVRGIGDVATELRVPAVFSVHPRTAAAIEGAAVAPGAHVRCIDPVGFHEFVALERDARLVLSDSGTVQEECTILRVPSVTLRDVTERPEALECGSTILGGTEPDGIARAARVALRTDRSWPLPIGYELRPVAETVEKLALGRLSWRRHG